MDDETRKRLDGIVEYIHARDELNEYMEIYGFSEYYTELQDKVREALSRALGVEVK